MSASASPKPRNSSSPFPDKNDKNAARCDSPSSTDQSRQARDTVEKSPPISSTGGDAKDFEVTMANPRSHLKRKAKKVAPVPVEHDELDLMKETLKPLEAWELEEWEGWVELESEPAFFNIILKELGVPDIRAYELFLVDADSLNNLPKPVYGLIFCYQYYETEDNTQDEEDTDQVWFANQTIDNACASVALLNTIMNIPDVRLSKELKDFKDSTSSLDTALRGHVLGKNVFIRSIHNSFSKRMNHLNSDLYLENKADAPPPRTTKPRKGARKQPPPKKRRRRRSESGGFHFLAFVPVGDGVWELDGMKSKPRHIGSEWTSCVAPEIQERMIQHQESAVAFSLLALCSSPLPEQRKRALSTVASLRHLHKQKKQDQDDASTNAQEQETHPSQEETDITSMFQLTEDEIEQSPVTKAVKDFCDKEKTSDEEAMGLRSSLIADIRGVIGQYSELMKEMSEEEERVQGRRKDYSPAIHQWLKILAGKGLLEELIKSC